MHLGHSYFASGSFLLLSGSIVRGIALHGPYDLRSRDAKLPVVRIDQKALPNNERSLTAWYFPDGDISPGLNSKYHSPTVTVTRGVESKDGKAVGINWCPEQPQPPTPNGKVYWCVDIRPKDGPDGSPKSSDNGDTLRIDMRTNTARPSLGDSDGFATTDKNRCFLSPDWQTDGKTAVGPGNSPGNQRTWQCTLRLPWATSIDATNSTANATSSAASSTAASTQPPTTAGTAVMGSPPYPTVSPNSKYMNSTANSTANSTNPDSSSSTTTGLSDSPSHSPWAEPDWFEYMEKHQPVEEITYDDYDNTY